MLSVGRPKGRGGGCQTAATCFTCNAMRWRRPFASRAMMAHATHRHEHESVHRCMRVEHAPPPAARHPPSPARHAAPLHACAHAKPSKPVTSHPARAGTTHAVMVPAPIWHRHEHASIHRCVLPHAPAGKHPSPARTHICDRGQPQVIWVIGCPPPAAAVGELRPAQQKRACTGHAVRWRWWALDLELPPKAPTLRWVAGCAVCATQYSTAYSTCCTAPVDNARTGGVSLTLPRCLAARVRNAVKELLPPPPLDTRTPLPPPLLTPWCASYPYKALAMGACRPMPTVHHGGCHKPATQNPLPHLTSAASVMVEVEASAAAVNRPEGSLSS